MLKKTFIARFMKIIGYGRQVEQRDASSDNARLGIVGLMPGSYADDRILAGAQTGVL